MGYGDRRLTRRRLLTLGSLTAAAAVGAACGPAGSGSGTAESGVRPSDHEPAPQSPAEARARLEAGNARFAAGTSTHPGQDAAARRSVSEHQHPWALIHGCVDSRVTPEILFDQGIGDLFVTRTGGNVLDDTIVGSMEFAVSPPYAVPLLIVLGHSGCGAITGTIDALAADAARPTAPGELVDIVDLIAPVARRIPRTEPKPGYVDEVVRANAISVAGELVRRSAIIRGAVESRRCAVVPARYDLATGRVEALDR